MQLNKNIGRMGGYLLTALALVTVVVLLTDAFRDKPAGDSQQELVSASTGAIVRTRASVPNTQQFQPPELNLTQGAVLPEDNSSRAGDASEARLQQLELTLGQAQEAFDARFQELELQIGQGAPVAENNLQRRGIFDKRMDRLEESVVQVIDAFEARFAQLEQQLMQTTTPIEDRLDVVEEQLVQTNERSMKYLQDLEKAQQLTTARLDKLSATTLAVKEKRGTTTSVVRENVAAASPPAQPVGRVASAVNTEPPAPARGVNKPEPTAPVKMAKKSVPSAMKKEGARQPGKEKVKVATPHKAGGWAINLASYAGKRTATKYLTSFQKQGVAVEMVTATVQGKTIYRVRVAGFDSLQAARAQAPAIKQKLGLEDAWFSRI